MTRSKSPKPRLRPLELKDVEQVAAIYAHYVANGVATFDEVAPDVEAWAAKAGSIVARGLPFLVAEARGQVAGFAYASSWRPKPAYRHTVEETVYIARPAARGLGSDASRGCRRGLP